MSDNILTAPPKMDYEEKTQQVDVGEFDKIVQNRRSIRVYTEEKIPDEVVEKCLDTALLAPNSSNLQPWEFYRVVSPEKKAKLIEYCMGQPAASTAAELIVCVARRDSWKKHAKQMVEYFNASEQETPKSALMYYQKLVPLAYGQGPCGIMGPFKKLLMHTIGLFKPIPREPGGNADMRVWMHKSTALACQNLMMAFSAHGYDSCPMEGLDSKRTRKLLGLPRKAEICMVVSAGKRKPDAVYGPRVRFPREQFIFKV